LIIIFNSIQKKQQRTWLRCLLCHDGLLADILERRWKGKPTSARKTLHMMSERNNGEKNRTVRRKAEDQIAWASK